MKKIKTQQFKLIEANNIFNRAEHVNIKELNPNKEPKLSLNKYLLIESNKNKDMDIDDNSFYDDFLRKINEDTYSQPNLMRIATKISPRKKERHSIKNQSKTKKERNIKMIRNFVAQSNLNEVVELQLSPIKKTGNKEEYIKHKTTKKRNTSDIKKVHENMLYDHNKNNNKKRIATALAFKNMEDDKIKEVVQMEFNSSFNHKEDNLIQPIGIHIENDVNSNDNNIHIEDKDNELKKSEDEKEKEEEEKDNSNSNGIHDIIVNNTDDYKENSRTNVIELIDERKVITQCDKEEIITDNNKNTNTNTDINTKNMLNTNIDHLGQMKKINSSYELDKLNHLSHEINKINHTTSLSKSNNNKLSSINQIEEIKPCTPIKTKKAVKKFLCFLCIPAV